MSLRSKGVLTAALSMYVVIGIPYIVLCFMHGNNTIVNQVLFAVNIVAMYSLNIFLIVLFMRKGKKMKMKMSNEKELVV